MTNQTMTSELDELLACMNSMEELRADMLDEEWALVAFDPLLMKVTEGEIMDDWEYLLVLDVYRDLVETDQLDVAINGDLKAGHGWMQRYLNMAAAYGWCVRKANKKMLKKIRKARS